jgi:hypothetical protein
MTTIQPGITTFTFNELACWFIDRADRGLWTVIWETWHQHADLAVQDDFGTLVPVEQIK